MVRFSKFQSLLAPVYQGYLKYPRIIAIGSIPTENRYIDTIGNTASDLTPVLQPWVKNLMVADIINENVEFRKREEITLS